MQETLVKFLGWEDPLEKGKATHTSILGFPCGSNSKESTCNAEDLDLIPGSGRSPDKGNDFLLQFAALRIPGTEKPDRQQSMGSQRVRHI